MYFSSTFSAIGRLAHHVLEDPAVHLVEGVHDREHGVFGDEVLVERVDLPAFPRTVFVAWSA